MSMSVVSWSEFEPLFDADAARNAPMPPAAGAADASAEAAGASSVSRTRPCDTCRLRKTRCVRDEGQFRCVLCTFHNQPCTFLRGPTQRQRRQNRERERERDRHGQLREGNDEQSGHYQYHDQESGPLGGTTTSPPLQNIGNGARQQGSSPTSLKHDDAASPLASDGSLQGLSPTRTQHQATTSKDKTHTAPRPPILSNTLGLDLATHAEYIGPTDYRDPVLLDLHNPKPSSSRDDSTEAPVTTWARRLDQRTIFLVHPDETTESEAQRIADLDAIEDTVRPLGRTLVDLYFRIVHPSFPILHKDVFISKHRASHRHFAPSLLAAVYLVALDWQLYDSSLAGRESQSIPDAAALEQLAEETMARDMRRPKLSTLEAGLLLLQRSPRVVESTSNRNTTSSRMFTAQMVAMAQDLGIHVDCSTWSIPGWEIGLRRRLAWALYMQDRWGACIHGRPFLIQDNDWDVTPCSAADYPELGPIDDTGADSNSTTEIGWELFIRHIELAHLLSDVTRTFYTTSASRTGGALDQMGVVAAVELAKPLVLRLRQWHANLPNRLLLESTKIRELCANGALHLAHAAVDIALHRALVRIMTPDTPEQLYDVVRSTARAKLQAAITLLGSLQPEHTAAFWGSASAYQAAEVGSLAGLLWATADSSEEMAWCAARVEELRWALRVRGAAAVFAREALRLLEREIGGLGMLGTKSDDEMTSGARCGSLWCSNCQSMTSPTRQHQLCDMLLMRFSPTTTQHKHLHLAVFTATTTRRYETAPIMPSTRSQLGNKDGGEATSATGEKHQTEHESPDAKRPKRETQTTLDDVVTKGEDDVEADVKNDGDKKEDENIVTEDQENGKMSESNGKDATSEDDAIKPSEEKDVPASILEKGIIYFFIRGRVNIEDPGSVDDIARSYMLLRPIDKDAKLGEGAISDAGNTRLLALPKKVLPTSGKDRFMVFVEKSGASYSEIKDEFLASNDYETKTVGSRHTPAATPVGEGVYAITTTGRETHLAYMLTLPQKLEEVQKELGLKEKGSFILSTKNPQTSGPANAQLPEGADYPKEVQNEFRSLRWLPSKPEHLNYVNSQILFIGESEGIENAVEPQKQDQKDGKKDPEEVLEQLEEEDLKRMKQLPGDQAASIFADLHVQASDYPKLQTTF
ncbi:hypothetical protein G7046_g8994 [Stylonectria norvegica]|nr:hypothetical protein G7046_g8994 [Stylonectria norvegica]